MRLLDLYFAREALETTTMGKDFRFDKSDWEEEQPVFLYKRDTQKRQRKVEQKRKDKLRNQH